MIYETLVYRSTEGQELKRDAFAPLRSNASLKIVVHIYLGILLTVALQLSVSS